MTFLDHRVPPALVGLLCAVLAWGLGSAFALGHFEFSLRLPLAVLCLLLGLGLDVWGLWAFRRHQTTPSPFTPQRSRLVVRSGPYRFTRNPMYLGMALLLLAWCLWLGSALALLALALFVGYITRFQIAAEERALAAKFGPPYAEYLQQVRRWL